MLPIHSSTSVNQGIWKSCALRWSRNFEMNEWMKKTFWASNFALKRKFFPDALMWMPQLSHFSHILPHRNGALWRARFGLVQTCLYTVLCRIPESMQCSFKVFFFHQVDNSSGRISQPFLSKKSGYFLTLITEHPSNWFNPLHAKLFGGEHNHIFTHFCVISPHWYDTGSWNPSSNKTRTYLFYIVNIMAADVLAT